MESILRLVLTVVTCLMLAPCAIAQQAAAKTSSKLQFGDVNGRLIIDPPTNLYEPGKPHTIDANQGDLVQLQIRHPVSPPFPVSAAISNGQHGVRLMAVSTTSSPATILRADPQSDGKIGVGFVQLWVRVTQPGKQRVTAHVKLQGGEVKDVPFDINVKAAE